MNRWVAASLALVAILALGRGWRGHTPSRDASLLIQEISKASGSEEDLATLSERPQRQSSPTLPAIAPASEISSQALAQEPGPAIEPALEKPQGPIKKKGLGGPMPRSVRELQAKLTPYQPPRSPGGDVNGLISNVFCGFVEEAGTFRELIVDRSAGALNEVKKVILEQKDGTRKTWSGQAEGLGVKSFDGDKYSLVLELPNQQLLYLKHLRFGWVPSMNGPFRPMRGWLLPGAGRVVLVDCVHATLDSPPTPAQLAPLLPEPLPLVSKDDGLEK